MDQSQLPYLMNLLKGTGIGPSSPNAQPPPPQANNSAFPGIPQQFMPSQLGGSPMTGGPTLGVPQQFLPSQLGGSPPPPGGYTGPNTTSLNPSGLFGSGGNLNNIQPLGI